MMRHFFFLPLISITVTLLFFPAHAALYHIGNSSIATPPTIAVWIYFTDKPAGDLRNAAVLPRTLARRRAAGFHSFDAAADQPVSPRYIRSIEELGGVLRHCFKWENAASFNLPVDMLPNVIAFPFVRDVSLVGNCSKPVDGGAEALGKKRSSSSGIYGQAFDHLSMLNIPRAHDYLSYRFSPIGPGSGVRIAIFDSGFRLRHRSFRHLLKRNAIKGAYDFVDRDSTVEDPDSVFNSPVHPYYQNDRHGSMVLSLIASYDPPYYCGVAWGADFLLARTEDAYSYDYWQDSTREVHAEEDNWAAAVVWAESLGVDIISSSVAYRSGFQDTIVIELENNRFDTIVDYPKKYLDGKTTIISRAARQAIARGIIIVNSIGNEGDEGDTSLDAPSDVDGVIAVGMINTYGYIDSRSSKGPTADGRLKPDVVAPGSGIYVPDVYAYEALNQFYYMSGTTFAAPLIAGICALVKQSDTVLDAAQVREKLYRYCRPPVRGAVVGNEYGRGIPDALLSCMRSGEAYLTAIDTGGRPLSAAMIESGRGDTLARFDASGSALVTLPSGSFGVVIRKDVDRRFVPFDSTPCRAVLYPCTLVVKVRDDNKHTIPYAIVKGTVGPADYLQQADDLGNLSIVSFFHLPIALVVSEAGYLRSDTLHLSLTDRKQESVVQLKPSVETTVSVYPTVIRRSRNESLHFRCSVPLGEPAKTLEVSIRSITGELIVHERYSIDPPVVDIAWDCRSEKASVSPGTYFAMVLFDGKKQRKKIIVAP